MSAPPIIVSGPFDDVRSRTMRFLEEASRNGPLHVLLWSDEVVRRHRGAAPKFPFSEREYFLNAVRYVSRVMPVRRLDNADELPRELVPGAACWADMASEAKEARAAFSRSMGIEYRVFADAELAGFPQQGELPSPTDRRKVIVTGCYDWLHSGHVRFFEEVSALGDLYVVVGHDANIRLLKGEGHPLLPEAERRYMAGSIRFVKQALVSSGEGWMDAAPEIERLKPDVYAVNEDGDRGGKREYCAKLGIEYRVLRREPAPGLPRRTSTDLRGF